MPETAFTGGALPTNLDVVVARTGAIQVVITPVREGLLIDLGARHGRSWDGYDITLTPAEARQLRDRLAAWFPVEGEDQR